MDIKTSQKSASNISDDSLATADKPNTTRGFGEPISDRIAEELSKKR